MCSEELFFFRYHLCMDAKTCMRIPVALRRWIVERFIGEKKGYK